MPFSSNPSTPSTGGKSILLADLESGEHKATKISINSMEESPSERPVLGRRRTTHSAPESDANIAALVEEEDALTKVGIGQAERDAALDGRMGIECSFDLGRIDIVAATHDHIGAAVGDIKIAIGIQVTEIA